MSKLRKNQGISYRRQKDKKRLHLEFKRIENELTLLSNITALNRTKLELKPYNNYGISVGYTNFKSHQIGIETLLTPFHLSITDCFKSHQIGIETLDSLWCSFES